VPFVVALLVWLAIAIAAGVSGSTARLRPPAPQLVLMGLTVALVIAGRSVAAFRRWLVALDWRLVVALHLLRFVGFYFLWLYQQGELPRAFAVPAGVGDVIVASSALVLLIFASAIASAWKPRLLLAWNTLGFADIIVVVVSAAGLAMRDPESMAALLRFPLSLLPTFLVPLIIASHVLLFARLRHWERRTSSARLQAS
jgi:hypothetical protein